MQHFEIYKHVFDLETKTGKVNLTIFPLTGSDYDSLLSLSSKVKDGEDFDPESLAILHKLVLKTMVESFEPKTDADVKSVERFVSQNFPALIPEVLKVNFTTKN